MFHLTCGNDFPLSPRIFPYFSLCEIPILRQTCVARVNPRRHRHQNPKVARRWRWPMWHLHRGSPGCCGGKCPGWPGDTKKKMWRKTVLGRKCVFHKCKCKYVCIHMSIFYMYVCTHRRDYLHSCMYIYIYDRETFRYHFVPVNSDRF